MKNAINYENELKKLSKTVGYDFYESMLMKARSEASYRGAKVRGILADENGYLSSLDADLEISLHEGVLQSVNDEINKKIEENCLSDRAKNLIESADVTKYSPAQIIKFIKIINAEVGKGVPQPE